MALQLLRQAAEAVGPPRALLVPFPHGYPLGRPNDAEIQHAVIEAALRLLEDVRLFEDDGLRPDIEAAPLLRNFIE